MLWDCIIAYLGYLRKEQKKNIFRLDTKTWKSEYAIRKVLSICNF